MSESHQQQKETIEQIKQEEQAKQNGEADAGAGDGDDPAGVGADLGDRDDDSGGLGISIPTPSTRTLVIAAVVLGVAFVLYRNANRSGGSESGPGARSSTNRRRQQGSSETSIELPSNPDNEIDKDKAVIDGLKRDGQLFARQQKQDQEQPAEGAAQ